MARQNRVEGVRQSKPAQKRPFSRTGSIELVELDRYRAVAQLPFTGRCAAGQTQGSAIRKCQCL